MSEEESGSEKFLGAGLAFPLQVDRQGAFLMNGLEEHVRQSILLIIRTAKGERVMRGDFGAGVDRLVFSPLTATTAALVAHEVREALVRFEPRIELLDVTANPDPGQPGVLLIKVDYRVRRTDTLFNLVYPFYLEKGIA